MNLEDMIKQCAEDSVRWFPGFQNLPLVTLAMAGEVGEVANLVKKVARGSHTVEQVREAGLEEEVVDVLIYLCGLMGLKEFEQTNWQKVWDQKRAFNEVRFGGRA
jgi:NTP pyrophosphatase (non-canonical NTP hydrolase)